MSVICPHCSRKFPGDKLNARHLAKCNPKPPPPPCLCGHESTSLTQMKRHRRTCEVWQSRDKKALANSRRRQTSLERYGVEDARRSPQADAKRARTNLERYGAENPFCREATTFEQVQASLEGKRPVLQGEDNPFARAEVQEKIRGHWQREHGVDNPQQVVEVRTRTKATNLERYGHEETLAAPAVREAIRETCQERYGGPAPSCSPEVQEKARITNQERFGVPWTCMDPEVRQRQLETHHDRYGSHWFASDEGKVAIREALLEKYGVEHWMKTPGAWGQLVATFRERYGVDHPLQDPEILAKMVVKMVATKMERYGSPWGPLMMDGPNRFEQRVHALAPQMMFTGDGAYWRKLPKLGHYKNPDFILPGPDLGHPFRGATKVVEAFGDFWHSRMFTGKAPFDHEQELIEAFAEVGLDCLVIWESEVKADEQAVKTRLEAFL